MERVAAGRLWIRHLLSLLFPLLTLIYVATGPHRAWESLPGLALVVAVVLLDGRARAVRDDPPEGVPRWPFTALVCTLAVMQLATVALLVRMVAIGGFTIDLILVGWFVGNNSGWGTLVVAHELIHRRSRPLRWLGRVLLWTVLYDHFFVEHLRGHHALRRELHRVLPAHGARAVRERVAHRSSARAPGSRRRGRAARVDHDRRR